MFSVTVMDRPPDLVEADNVNANNDWFDSRVATQADCVGLYQNLMSGASRDMPLLRAQIEIFKSMAATFVLLETEGTGKKTGRSNDSV